MKTSKPISTISYNSVDFLELKLNELLKCKKIEFWAFICHKPEDDESKLKPHSHVYMIPSSLLQTEDIREYLQEYDPQNPNKPLGVIRFASSKRFGDWCLYVLHDTAYLASKSQSRKYHYSYSNIRTSDQETMDNFYQNIDLMEVSKYKALLEAQKTGVTWAQFFSRGTVPIQQITAWRTAWDTISSLKTNELNRNGNETHTPRTPIEILDEFGDLCIDHNMDPEEIYECFYNWFRRFNLAQPN